MRLASNLDISEASGKKQASKTGQHKKAGFYMRSKTVAKGRLLCEDMPEYSCRLLDI